MTQSRFDAFDLSRAGARHRGAATLAVVALALAVSGCRGGGGAAQMSQNQYEARLQADGQQIAEVFKPLSTPPKSLPTFASSIEKGQAKLREVANDLESVKPPKDVAADNNKLVAGLRAFAAQLEPLRKGAASRNEKQIRRAALAIRVAQPLKGAQQATADMKKKGYHIGELGR